LLSVVLEKNTEWGKMGKKEEAKLSLVQLSNLGKFWTAKPRLIT